MNLNELNVINSKYEEIGMIKAIAPKLRMFKDEGKGTFLIDGYEVKREWCSDVHLAGLITIMEQRIVTLQKQFDEL